MERVRTLLAEDDPRLQQAFEELAHHEPSLDLLGVAGDGDHAVQLALQFEPQVVLMDIQMPRLNGIEATRRIKRAVPHVQVVIWTVFGDYHACVLSHQSERGRLPAQGQPHRRDCGKASTRRRAASRCCTPRSLRA
jgi:Response regulator containing a CheY-like receiver domain and an HTH DNA-binding domain